MVQSRRAKELIPKTAKDCNVSEELTNDVVDFFYLTFRKKIENIDTPVINIPILGKFVVIKYKIVKSIEKLKVRITEEKPNDFNKMKHYYRYKDNLVKHILILEKIKKREDDKRKFKKDLAEQEQNS